MSMLPCFMAYFAVGCGGVIDIDDRDCDSAIFQAETEAAGERDCVALAVFQWQLLNESNAGSIPLQSLGVVDIGATDVSDNKVLAHCYILTPLTTV